MKKTPKLSKTFIVFLCASLFIWALIKLSKQYTSYVTFPVEYTDLSQDRLLQKAPHKDLKILLKGSGFRLVSSNFSKNNLKLSTNKLDHKINNDYYFLTSKLKNYLQLQIGDNLEIKGFKQDSIFLSLGKLKSKKVKVLPVVNANYQLGYDLSKKIIVTPDSVVISGPENQINQINNVKTQELNIEDVNKDINFSLQLESFDDFENIRVSHKKVQIFGKVDKYTEGSLMVPFSVKNIPFGVELNTFPKEVKITFKVTLSDFNSVTPKSFVVECDYEPIELNNLSYLTPKITTKPTFVSSLKMVPNKIEFLIQK